MKDELASCLVFVVHGGRCCVRLVAVFMDSTVIITYNLPRNDVPRSVWNRFTLCRVDCGKSPVRLYVEYSIMNCNL